MPIAFPRPKRAAPIKTFAVALWELPAPSDIVDVHKKVYVLYFYWLILINVKASKIS